MFSSIRSTYKIKETEEKCEPVPNSSSQLLAHKSLESKKRRAFCPPFLSEQELLFTGSKQNWLMLEPLSYRLSQGLSGYTSYLHY